MTLFKRLRWTFLYIAVFLSMLTSIQRHLFVGMREVYLLFDDHYENCVHCKKNFYPLISLLHIFIILLSVLQTHVIS